LAESSASVVKGMMTAMATASPTIRPMSEVSAW
jgi:hypothetical protein